MGQLYDRAGQWSRAKDLMTASLTRRANEPEVLLAVSRSFLNHDEYEDAGRWLDKLDEVLKTLPPEIVPTYQPAAHELRARLLVKLGRPDEAVAVLERLVPNPLPPDKFSMLRDVSMLMEQLGQLDAAKRLLDQYVQQDPHGALSMAAFLGRQGEVDQAFALLEKSRTSESVVNILAVAIEALRGHPDQASPARFAKLEEWGKAGLQNETEKARIKLLLAEAYDLQGRYPEVVRLYREVLAAKETKPDQAAVVKNNLAFVLAVTNQNLPEALKLISESIHVLGPNSDLLDTRGLVYLNQGDLPKAIADLRMSATDTPSISKYLHLCTSRAACQQSGSCPRRNGSGRRVWEGRWTPYPGGTGKLSAIVRRAEVVRSPRRMPKHGHGCCRSLA